MAQEYPGKYLEVSFPYSNKGYLQLFYGENMECLLEGLDAIFRHIGAVPDEIWFDNAKTIVTKVIKEVAVRPPNGSTGSGNTTVFMLYS